MHALVHQTTRLRKLIYWDQASVLTQIGLHSAFFNGHAAEQLFMRLVAKTLSAAQSQRLTFVRLPSTSPAHATLPRAQKKGLWQRAITLALHGTRGTEISKSKK